MGKDPTLSGATWSVTVGGGIGAWMRPNTVSEFVSGKYYWNYKPCEGNVAKSVANGLPRNRQELNENLIGRGFYVTGRTQGGYVEYRHPDGTKVWIRSNGEVITLRKAWLPDMSRKVEERYMWDGSLVPNRGHNTGEFVEPIAEGSFVPPLKKS
ncbi:MAG: hypothetical protein LBG71_02005 [Clostridiales Family XIII bacterium]|jgi:hypothetical protein|nr:hypothetical protein [Clostridiales Family XIII bacterium]